MSKDTEGKTSEKIMDGESNALWCPDAKKNTHMNRFRAHVSADYGVCLGEWTGGAGTGEARK